MKALVFHFSLPRLALATILGKLTPAAYLSSFGPTRLEEVPEPTLPADDWVIVRTRLCGICGSDTKQVFLDGDYDNPLRSLLSFPAVLGHEATGVVERVGPGVTSRRMGERVVVNPWLSCEPRGIEPLCDACQRGQHPLCQNFTKGCLSPALHLGNCREANGGFAPLIAVHESQLFLIPEGVSFEQAVLSDPFSVSLHAILKAPPADGELALIYGAGTLGLLSLAVLRALYPKARAVIIAKYPYQAALAREMGATDVICPRDPLEVIASVARLTGAEMLRPQQGKPWLLRGADVIYDTIGSPESLEVGLRVAKPRASIVVSGVNRAGRFEWTPWYFKEIAIIGSNAFGVESFQGEELHSMEIYLRLCAQGKLDLARLVTHRFRLEQYREGLLLAHRKARAGAIKVAFDFPAT